MSAHTLAHSIRAQHGRDCIKPLALTLFYNCDWPVKPTLKDQHWTRRAIKLAEQSGIDFVFSAAGNLPVTDSHASHTSGQSLTHDCEVTA